MAEELDKCVRHELNENQTNRRFEVCSALHLRKRTVWQSNYDVRWKVDLSWQPPSILTWLHFDEVPKHFPKPELHQKNIMVTVWWSTALVIHYNFLNPGETNTAEKYCREIGEMHRKLLGKQPALLNWKDQSCFMIMPDRTFCNRQSINWTS
jgi:hypothetical protein